MTDPGATRETVDGLCIRCEYDLAGVPLESVCPECGLAVTRSRIRSMLMRCADERWVGLVRRGLRDLEIAMNLLFAGFVVLMLLLLGHVVVRGVTGAPAPKIFESIAEVSAVLLVLGAAAIHIRGVLLSTLSSHRDYGAPMLLRTVVRFCGVLLPLSIGGAIVLRQEMTAYSGAVRMAIRAGIELNAVVYFFALAGLLEHYERRTAAWNVERRMRHARVRLNLGALAVLLIINHWIYWVPILGMLIAGVPVLLLGIAYLAFNSAVGRVREEIQIEHLIGKELGAQKTAE